MPIAGERLRKVTLNLYDKDVAWFQNKFGHGYTEEIRKVVRKYIKERDEDGQ